MPSLPEPESQPGQNTSTNEAEFTLSATFRPELETGPRTRLAYGVVQGFLSICERYQDEVLAPTASLLSAQDNILSAQDFSSIQTKLSEIQADLSSNEFTDRRDITRLFEPPALESISRCVSAQALSHMNVSQYAQEDNAELVASQILNWSTDNQELLVLLANARTTLLTLPELDPQLLQSDLTDLTDQLLQIIDTHSEIAQTETSEIDTVCALTKHKISAFEVTAQNSGYEPPDVVKLCFAPEDHPKLMRVIVEWVDTLRSVHKALDERDTESAGFLLNEWKEIVERYQALASS